MHRVQCKCGAVRGHVQGKGTSNRVVCYCTDCRAYAKFLGSAEDVLDAHGGTEIVQVALPRLTFTQGRANLAAVRLSDKGMLRWYAACCKTPIGNTLSNPKIGFVGMVHSSLDRANMDADFGRNVSVLNTDSAIGDPKPKQRGVFGAIVRFLWIVLSTRVFGRWRKSQLFDESGDPIARPTVLSPDELNRLKAR